MKPPPGPEALTAVVAARAAEEETMNAEEEEKSGLPSGVVLNAAEVCMKAIVVVPAITPGPPGAVVVEVALSTLTLNCKRPLPAEVPRYPLSAALHRELEPTGCVCTQNMINANRRN